MLEMSSIFSVIFFLQVAVLIAQGEAAAAVKALNGYLSDFAADAEAWLQLAKLHVDALNYEVNAIHRCAPETSPCLSIQWSPTTVRLPLEFRVPITVRCDLKSGVPSQCGHPSSAGSHDSAVKSACHEFEPLYYAFIIIKKIAPQNTSTVRGTARVRSYRAGEPPARRWKPSPCTSLLFKPQG